MKRLLLLVIVLLLLGSVELVAQYRYDFEFEVICPGPFTLWLWTNTHNNPNTWTLWTPPSGNYWGSQTITRSISSDHQIYQAKVQAAALYGGSFFEIREVYFGLNYFFIDLRTIEDPTPPDPDNIDE